MKHRRTPVLAAFTFAMLPVVAPAPGAGAAQDSRPASGPAAAHPAAISEENKIDALIDAIAALDEAVFIRNDEGHAAREAADHLRMKRRAAGDRIATARQFIEHIASRSSTTGEVYRIRFADGREVASGEYLTSQLERLEGGAVAGASVNPAAPGFDEAGSDPRAIEIADSVMEKMGGRKAWDETRYVTWRFFGGRLHVWDKHTGDIRIEMTSRDGGEQTVLLANLNSKAGRAWINGAEVIDEAQRAGLVNRGISIWINDSYWLVMPYKLKDSGVTLTYRGEAEMEDGRAADVLQLTFRGVGDTPDNKYEVYVARDSGLVEQWSYYRTAADAEPGFTCAWHNWRRCGDILLSDDRGLLRGNPVRHTDVAVFDELPRSVFEGPEPFVLADYQDHEE